MKWEPYIAALWVLLFSSCGKERAEPTFKKPNIVLIVVDDLGYKDVGFMGSRYYETPNLDQFAQEGMVFTRGYAAAANCAPSRACIMTGLNTPRHGVYTVSPSERGDARLRKIVPVKNTNFVSDTAYTLPKMLKSAGYITGSFGKWHIGKDPKKQGMDVNVGGSQKGNPGKDGYFSPYNIDYIEDGPDDEYLTDRLTSDAISFLEKNKDTTFFMYVPFYTVHTPIMGKPDLVERYRNKKGDEGQHNAEYAAMVHSMDENVGKILQSLKDLRLEENTLVVFTSDNGGIRSISAQDPLRAGKGSYYEGGIRVPFVMRWPNKIKVAENLNLISHLDLYPTLQEIVKPPKSATLLDGQSLVSMFTNTQVIDRELFFHFPIYLQAYDPQNDRGRDPLFRTRPGAVIISEEWKVHQYFEDDTVELYNLDDDLGERNNIAAKYPEKTDSLLRQLHHWQSETSAPIPKEANLVYDSAFELLEIRKYE